MDDTPALEVYLLGLVDFLDTQRLQRRLVYDLGENGRGGSLILCEHPPTISVGRAGSRVHIAADLADLKSRGVRVHWVNRGGGCVLHLPGQLAAYVAMPLDRLGLSLMGHVEKLEQAILGVLEEFGLKGSLEPGYPGVFLGPSRVATLGVAVRRGIAYHGMTLNVGPYLDPFRVIDEPGPRQTEMRHTSMEAQRQRPAPMAKVRESMIRQVQRAFELDSTHLYTDHPLIRRIERLHVYAASLR